MNFLIMLLISIGILSCSFKKEEVNSEQAIVMTEDLEVIPLTRDFDGDMVSDLDEIAQGRNYKVADFPKLNVKFLQNFKAIVEYQSLSSGEKGQFEIDTNVHEDDPNFKYRVGQIFIRDQSYNKAASVGKFNSHSYGDIEERDFTWVKYPELDRKFHGEMLLKYKRYFDTTKYEITNVRLELESSLKLAENLGFKSIKNPKVSFYYYDYEKESYEQLKEELIERHFLGGVNEVFKVSIDSVPAKLILENLFERGEFVISELSDYEIPELETTYKTLLASVKTKSLPVILNTPHETTTYYVGTDGNKIKFIDVLKSLFDQKFEVSDNNLVRINQFENNLSEFTYLTEVANEDKKGRWFIFTNKLTKHYLDHDFAKSDLISLTYALGSDLANQVSEPIFSYREDAQSGEFFKEYPLGNVTFNSAVSIQLSPQRRYGEKLTSWEDTVISHGGSCGVNCISNEYQCFLKFNILEEITDDKSSFSFNQNLESELSRVTLRLNQTDYKLKELLDEKKVELSWVDNHLFIKIPKVSSLQELKEADDNLISLRLTSINEELEEGLLMHNMAGKQSYYCPIVISNIAGPNGWPINYNSKEFGAWQHLVNWDHVKKSGKRAHKESFSMGISALVENKFN